MPKPSCSSLLRLPRLTKPRAPELQVRFGSPGKPPEKSPNGRTLAYASVEETVSAAPQSHLFQMLYS